MYSKEELAELIIKNPEEYNSYKKTIDGVQINLYKIYKTNPCS